jgi:EAL and modified HD-GYP domain-containing signal transduction protein
MKTRQADTRLHEPTMTTPRDALFMARQPVHDISGNLWGYKILLHHPAAGEGPDNAYASSARGVLDGLPLLADKDSALKLLIPFPARLIAKGAGLALPSGPVGLEVMEPEPPGPQPLAACRHLKEQGVLLGLRHFPRLYLFDHLLELADIISASPAALMDQQLRRLVEEKPRFHFRLLAEAVEDQQTLDRARNLGFDLFWGGMVQGPDIVEGRIFSTAEMTRLRVIRELFRNQWDVQAISGLIRADGALSYRLLAYLNSAWFALGEPVDTVSKALMLLGGKRLKHWLLLVVMADVAESSGAEEVLVRMAERGRLLELLAESPSPAPLPPETMFLLGSFSLLGELLRAPLASVLDELPVGEALSDALLRGQGPAAKWLAPCELLEAGRFEEMEQSLQDLGVDPALAASAHQQARDWAARMLAR